MLGEMYMINLKSPFKTNNKSLSKRHSYLIWCIVALFFTLSITFKGICGSATKNNTITLPTSRDGIEKIEYMIDGMPQGSTDGIGKIEVEKGLGMFHFL